MLLSAAKVAIMMLIVLEENPVLELKIVISFVLQPCQMLHSALLVAHLEEIQNASQINNVLKS
jgi:hypothetical protein